MTESSTEQKYTWHRRFGDERIRFDYDSSVCRSQKWTVKILVKIHMPPTSRCRDVGYQMCGYVSEKWKLVPRVDVNS